MTECLFCDRTFPCTQGLVEHLVAAHRGVFITGGDRFIVGNRGKRTVRCWCGARFSYAGVPTNALLAYTPSHFAGHLDRRGGLAAHVLELGLRQKGKSGGE